MLRFLAHSISLTVFKHLASKLDTFATRDILYFDKDNALVWVFFGLTKTELITPSLLYRLTAAQSFNRFSRVLWEYALFDRFLELAGFASNTQCVTAPDPETIKRIITAASIKSVRHPLYLVPIIVI